MARYLFGEQPGLVRFGGYGDAERKMICYLPDYLDVDNLYDAGSPVGCLHADYYEGDTLSDGDFLGALPRDTRRAGRRNRGAPSA